MWLNLEAVRKREFLLPSLKKKKNFYSFNLESMHRIGSLNVAIPMNAF